MKMSKTLTIVLVIVGIVLVLGIWMSRSYNGMVNAEENVQKAWAQVENVYQRRADLIPNLVNTVSGAANFERQTLTDVINARANATSVTIDPTNLTESNIAAFQQAQNQLSSALSRLLVSVERYPELKANQNFLELQSQLEGTENRITVARNQFNDEVNKYNNKVRYFPSKVIAGMFGFEKKGYFTAQPGAETAPDVSFDFGS